jgi:hypothetical protein
MKNKTTFNREPHNSENTYTVISNKLVNDDRLTATAKGIMLMILSNSDNYVLNISYIQKISGVGEVHFQTNINKLKELGYLIKSRIQGGYHWIINESPRPVDSHEVDLHSEDSQDDNSQNEIKGVLINTNKEISNNEINTNEEINKNGNKYNNIGPDIGPAMNFSSHVEDSISTTSSDQYSCSYTGNTLNKNNVIPTAQAIEVISSQENSIFIEKYNKISNSSNFDELLEFSNDVRATLTSKFPKEIWRLVKDKKDLPIEYNNINNLQFVDLYYKALALHKR